MNEEKCADNSHGVWKYMLREMPIDELRRLYNSGMMPAPMTIDGKWDLETSHKIEHRIKFRY